jgi:hypothetical protein
MWAKGHEKQARIEFFIHVRDIINWRSTNPIRWMADWMIPLWSMRNGGRDCWPIIKSGAVISFEPEKQGRGKLSSGSSTLAL